MSLTSVAPEAIDPHLSGRISPAFAWSVVLILFFGIHVAALFSPSLMDDADTTHASAAQHMLDSGDWVTLKVDGIRYLEKPPLPYWLAAIDFRLFGENVFATHLPVSLAVFGCSLLAWAWGRRAYSHRAGFYAAIAVLTSMGVFLFTRIYIPEVLLTLFLALALYAFLTGIEDCKPGRFYLAWAALALAVLTKGLIAPVFFFAAVLPYLALTGQWRRWRDFRILTGGMLFLAIAAPWHVLAGLRNPDQGHPVGVMPTPGNVHGFFYFYFVNEHVLRFLGTRYPHDYNKLPAILYWTLHLVWLFPWSIFFPLAIWQAWKSRRAWRAQAGPYARQTVDFYLDEAEHLDVATRMARTKFRARTNLLLGIYAAVILLFFSISTNQEYYTFPAYLPLLLITAGVLASAEALSPARTRPASALIGAHMAFAVIGLLAAATLGYCLWISREVPFVSDIGKVLAHRNVGDYSLSMSHFFDLTGPSFAALRLPAILAMMTLLLGPLAALLLRRAGRNLSATVTVAFTAALFLVAAHIALVRFEPMLSSRAMADTINRLSNPADTLMLYGDQSDGSSVLFYTHRRALLVHGRSSSMIWGSYYPDAPDIFPEDAELVAIWGAGERKWLFVPGDAHDHVVALLGARLVLVQQLADKTLYTNRPLP